MEEKYILTLLVIFALVVLAVSLDFNGIFVDEEYYITIGTFAMQGKMDLMWNPLNNMFGFYVAPLVYGLADMAGGLLLARFISSLFITGTCVCVYFITKNIFNERSAALSFLLALFFAPVFLLGRFAVIDVPALFFMTLSILLLSLVHEKNISNPHIIVAASSIILFMAFLSKYITLLAFLPLLALLERKLWFHFATPYILLVVSYVLIFINEIHILIESQLVSKSSLSFAYLPLLLYLFAVYVICLFFSSRKKLRYIYLAGAVLFIGFHIFASYANFFKHAAFAFVFIAPFVSNGLENLLARRCLRIFTIILLVLMGALFLAHNYGMEMSYPDERNASVFLDNIVSSGDTVLIEGSAYRYYTAKLGFTSIQESYWYDYNNDSISENIDFKQALENKEFRAVLVTGHYKTPMDIDSFINSTDYLLVYAEQQDTIPPRAIRIYALDAGR